MIALSCYNVIFGLLLKQINMHVHVDVHVHAHACCILTSDNMGIKRILLVGGVQ